MTLVPNSSLGIQNTSSLRTRSSHLRVPTARDPNRPHVVDSRPRIDQRWLITVRTLRMENLRAESLDPKSCLAPRLETKATGEKKATAACMGPANTASPKAIQYDPETTTVRARIEAHRTSVVVFAPCTS